MLGSRGEEASIMSCFGGRTLGDWLTLSCSLYLANNDEKYPLRGGEDVDFGELALFEGETMGRGLHGGLGLDGT